ncbi:MAG: DUF885 domain-containing protein [Lachnospiraceae bacterium]|nr:DUF885 domain-containing protein [Lachnospiraceae bacterium]
MKPKKRATLLLFCFLVIFSLGISSFVYLHTTRDRAFQRLTEELLLENLEQNSLLTHFLVKNPDKLELSEEICLPIYSKDMETERILRLQDLYDRLNALDLSKADSNELLLRDSLSFYLAHSLKLSEFSYFEEPFSPYSGVQNELPILLTEYSMESREDIESYLAILSLLPDYLDSLCQYEKEKAAAGMFMSDAIADEAIASLDHFRNLNEMDNPLLTCFEAKVKALLSSGAITPEEYAHYIEENTRLVTTVVLPAYEKTGDVLVLLKSGARTSQQGVCTYENGRQYYEILVSSLLGEDINVTALKNAFTRQLMEDYATLNKLLESNPEYFISMIGNERTADPLRQLSPEQCIEILKNMISNDFPAVDESLYPYQLKDVEASMEGYTNPAYYFTPPIDDSTQNVIYINRSQTPEGIALFTTLAHEGFPGHLYQSVATANSFANNNLPSLSGISYFGGYIEGYATYVELLSYEYAKQAAVNLTGNEDASLYYEYLYYNRRICLNLYSILDIMIHYENASIGEIRPYLYKIGITSDEDIRTVYNYIVMEPGTYITYYGGYIKILECKNLAKDCWGDAYSERAFHTLLLELGPQSFDNIKKAIRQRGGTISGPQA